MTLFHVIDDVFVILRTKGVFRQARVYRRERGVYAEWGKGFILLCGGGGTSHPNTSWLAPDEYHTLHPALTKDSLGRPAWSGAQKLTQT